MARSKPYVYAIDFVRMATIIGVVLVHSVRFALTSSDPLWGGLVQMLFQYGRESFMVVTGFVLAYQYLERAPTWWTFWKRRYRALLPPYLVWLAIFVGMSFPVWPVLPWLGHYVQKLPTGNGHLYYVVLTMELYVLAPAFMALLRWGRSRPWTLASLAVAWQLLIWTLAGYVGIRDVAPQMLVWTYGGYFILGGVAAAHWPKVSQWLYAKRHQIALGLGLAVLTMGATYGLDLSWHHSISFATDVFQPISVVYSLMVTIALFATGTWFNAIRLERAGWDRWVRQLGNTSFGIYLIHPIFVHGWINSVNAAHIDLSPWLNAPLTALLSLALSVAVISGLQRTPRLAWLVGEPRTIVNPRVPASHSGQAMVS